VLCAAVAVMLLGGFYRWRIQQLRRQEKHLRDVVETIPAMAFSSGPDGSAEFVNRPWLDYSGLPEKANLGSGWQLTIHPDDLDEHLSKWRASLATGAPFENESRQRDSTGEYRWFLVRAGRCAISMEKFSSGMEPLPTLKIVNAQNKNARDFASYRQISRMRTASA
jgi:PAS domain S-box-containing protein